MRRKAFALVEIMIVVSIVLIILAIGVPNILRARVFANESTAIADLKIINSSCQAYHLDNDQYPVSLLALANAHPPYLDSTLADGVKHGYNFVYEQVTSDHFIVNANSRHTGLLKGRYFYLDELGIVRANSEEAAGPNDEVVG